MARVAGIIKVIKLLKAILNIRSKQISIRVFVLLLTVANAHLVFAANIDSIRLWRAPDNTRLVFDLDNKATYKHFTLENPHRLVIDIEQSSIKDSHILKDISWDDTDIAQLRYSTKKKYLRIVLDLKNKIKYQVFSLPPNGIIYGHRIVIDIANKLPTQSNKDLPKLTNLDYSKLNQKRKFNIVIDPGHGGEDPGAIGGRGTREKDVVLQISKYLQDYINQDKDMQAILTRDRDYYIGLRARTELARNHQADLFVSVHADGFKDSRAKGASVWVLSERGASSELAKWIENSENASDLVGGVSLDNKDTMLATVLLDLSQTASNRSSMQVANNVLKSISKVSRLHKPSIERAGLLVLKSPDIPSILVETGFITNSIGEKNLRSSSYQRKMAYAIYKGIKEFLKTQPRPSFSTGLMHAKND